MANGKIKVLVVEDSLVFRSLLVKYINRDPELQVVAVASNPFEARDEIIKHNPDVMTLDVELPKMDGIEFLRKLMPQYPVRTIMISALSNRVFEALQVGAVDFVEKPNATDRSMLDEFVKSELPEKIKAAARAKLRSRYGNTNVFDNLPRKQLAETDGIIVAIGASTGGTEATTTVLTEFGKDIPGVVIVQHMPEGFTKMYADRLNAQLQVNVKEAEQGDVVKQGWVYIAPGGDRHMEVLNKNGQYIISLRQGDKVNGHRPSVDVLFESVAKAAGNKAVGVILTGMGGDGAKGLLAMRKAGARTIGQDESTCVVYGMPRVAFELNAVESQNKLSEIAKKTYYFVDQIQKSLKDSRE